MGPLARASVLTFDCYGTLIDWESGLLAALQPVLRAHGVSCGDEDLLRLYGTLEPKAEAGPFRPYKDVLVEVMGLMGGQLGFVPDRGQARAIVSALPSWPPFADSVAALRSLQQRYRLGIVSNVDEDLFAQTEAHLGIAFDWVVTAQRVGAYKPDAEVFAAALRIIGAPVSEVVHVAQSLYHDIGPAGAAGLSTVWVDRRRGRSGSGATPPAQARPDLVVGSLEELAALAGSR